MHPWLCPVHDVMSGHDIMKGLVLWSFICGLYEIRQQLVSVGFAIILPFKSQGLFNHKHEYYCLKKSADEKLFRNQDAPKVS